MLLPVFAIGVTCAYAIFNKNAYQSYYGDTINEINYVATETEDLQRNKEYKMFDYPTLTESGWQDYFICGNNFQIIRTSTEFDPTNIVKFGFYVASSRTSVLFYTANNTLVKEYYFDVNPTLQFSFTFESFERRYTFNHLQLMSDDFLNEVQYNSNSFVSEVFYYSIDKVQQSPLFNWAHDSFLATPITYITGLFGMSNDHVAVMFMSYWLAVSVIWLVFDIVMYVPLLVHRWIDKGVLE